MELPFLEQLLVYSSHILSAVLVIYLWKHQELKLAFFFVTSFFLMCQRFYLISFFDVLDSKTEEIGRCVASLQDYYLCLSIYDRISIHAAQVGSVLVGLAILLLAQKMVKKQY